MSDAPATVEDVSRAYFLARAFDYPQAELWDQLEGKRLRDIMHDSAVDELPMLRLDSVIPYRTQAQREEEYLSTFELGGVPLYEGLHRKDAGREGILEELMRFYEFFGLRIRDQGRDYPDHLVIELEFMAYLAAREELALQEGGDVAAYRRAQRDFIVRHLGPWVPLFCDRVRKHDPCSIYATLAAWLAAFVLEQKERLELNIEGEES